MDRRSHDSSRPESGHHGARFRDQNCYAQRASARTDTRTEPRERIDYHSADCVTLRLAEAGRTAGLRGAVAEVLDAVITMLPRRWSRIRDNRIRLRQLVRLCPSNPHQRTVGRALRRLEALDLIRYSPACGRGATATITVHQRFLEGIEELERDESGSVVVPFSRPRTSLFPKGKVPQPSPHVPTPDDVPGPRPVEVPVDRAELRAVLENLPPVFSELPRNLRWLLGSEVRNKLARGHRPKEIMRILAAPAPCGVQRPFKLAIWRLTQNMVGAGPNLRPLQREWEQAQRADSERTRLADLAEDYRKIESVTTAEQRDQLVAAIQGLFGPSEDPRIAVLTAVRRSCRQYPGMPTTAAVAAWLDNGDQRLNPRVTGGDTAGTAVSVEGLQSITAGPDHLACVSCGSPGVLRPELPLPTVACDECLDRAAEDDGGDQSWAAAS